MKAKRVEKIRAKKTDVEIFAIATKRERKLYIHVTYTTRTLIKK